MSDNNPKKIANLRKLKILGLTGLAISATVIGVVVIFSFLPKNNDYFTITVDNSTDEEVHFSMQENISDSHTTNYLSGEPIKKAYVVQTSKVISYLDTFNLESIGGSHNMDDEDPGKQGYHDALVYTCFLTNKSASEEQRLKYSVSLEGLEDPSNNVASPFTYLRILCVTSIVGDDNDIHNQESGKFYAYRSSTGYSTVEGENDYREAIGYTTFTRDEQSRTVRSGDTAYYGEHYCTNFLSDKPGNDIVQDYCAIPEGKVMRFTFVAYFEAEDEECKGAAPKDSHLLMSLHFGA